MNMTAPKTYLPPPTPDDHLLPGDRVFIDTAGGWKHMDTKAVYLKSRPRESFDIFKNYPGYLHWIEIPGVTDKNVSSFSNKSGWYADHQVILAPVQRRLI